MGNGGEPWVLIMCERHTRQCNMDLPSRDGSLAGWTNRRGSSSGVPERLANLGCHLGRLQVGPCSHGLLQCYSRATPYYSRSSLRGAAGESGHLQSAARGGLCGVKVSATMRHGMESMARRSLTGLAPQFAPVDTRRAQTLARARMRQRFTRYGTSRESIRLRQHSDWAAMSLPREASYTANVRAP